MQIPNVDVGRSCVVVTIGGKCVMFDCGMHMGYNDERRFPDFTVLSVERQFDRVIDLVVISHL
jgi:integrator complex subunit 11